MTLTETAHVARHKLWGHSRADAPLCLTGLELLALLVVDFDSHARIRTFRMWQEFAYPHESRDLLRLLGYVRTDATRVLRCIVQNVETDLRHDREGDPGAWGRLVGERKRYLAIREALFADVEGFLGRHTGSSDAGLSRLRDDGATKQPGVRVPSGKTDQSNPRRLI